MKKKGFTLIELLAVIVILAIIALIATPLVLKYIEKSRTNSKITSTQNYIKAVETSLASYSITNKGKSYPEGCYEINTLNTDLDISIKGDIPTEGKVCIENNKIEKAIVKYPDNKIIKYEDDKSTISDEETYESFNSVSNYIIDADVEFVVESQNSYVATLPITKEIADQFEDAVDYDFIIDNGEVEIITGVLYSSNLMFYSSTNEASKVKMLQISDDQLMIRTMGEFVGVKNVKIGNPKPTKVRSSFRINDSHIAMTSYDFVEGEANIIIKNEDDHNYYEGAVELTKNNGIIGIDNTCRDNIPELPDVYTDLINGKTITIEVIQVIEGKEIVSTASGNLNTMILLSGEYATPNIALAAIALLGC